MRTLPRALRKPHTCLGELRLRGEDDEVLWCERLSAGLHTQKASAWCAHVLRRRSVAHGPDEVRQLVSALQTDVRPAAARGPARRARACTIRTSPLRVSGLQSKSERGCAARCAQRRAPRNRTSSCRPRGEAFRRGTRPELQKSKPKAQVQSCQLSVASAAAAARLHTVTLRLAGVPGASVGWRMSARARHVRTCCMTAQGWQRYGKRLVQLLRGADSVARF